jgi:hypothetical protein
LVTDDDARMTLTAQVGAHIVLVPHPPAADLAYRLWEVSVTLTVAEPANGMRVELDKGSDLVAVQQGGYVRHQARPPRKGGTGSGNNSPPHHLAYHIAT